jgi:GT2 family glycosyltransferase
MFSIIVPVFDPFDRLVFAGAIQSALSKALALEGAFELIVVNNNPIAACPQLTGYLRSLAEATPERLRILEPNANLGTARGFNAGLRIARLDSRYVVFMSTDADIVDSLMLRKIQLELDNHPTVGIAHPFSVFEDMDAFNVSSKYSCRAFFAMLHVDRVLESTELAAGELKHIARLVSARKGIASPFPGTPLTFAVHRRDMFDRIGLFDEGVAFGCFENLDLGIRALYGGYDVVRLNAVFVNHRRLYVRKLIVGGTPEDCRLPHSDVIQQSKDWWDTKWRRPPNEVFAIWRWGPYLYAAMLPYFALRRLASYFKGLLARWALRRRTLMSGRST